MQESIHCPVLQRWVAKLFPKLTRLEVVKTSSTTITLEQWRSERGLVGSAVRVWNDADFQLMIQVLRNEHPAWGALHPLAGNEVRAARQALIEGYTMAITNLEAMRVYKKQVELEEPTYEPEQAR